MLLGSRPHTPFTPCGARDDVQEFDLAGLLAGEEAQWGSGAGSAGGEGGMEEEHCVAMQYVQPQGPRVMSSKALAKAQEIVGDDEEEGEEEEDEEDDDDEEEEEEE